jgi:hypothetical protein
MFGVVRGRGCQSSKSEKSFVRSIFGVVFIVFVFNRVRSFGSAFITISCLNQSGGRSVHNIPSLKRWGCCRIFGCFDLRAALKLVPVSDPCDLNAARNYCRSHSLATPIDIHLLGSAVYFAHNGQSQFRAFR